MQDCGDDGGLAAAIPALTYLRRNELLEGGWEFYGPGKGAALAALRAVQRQFQSISVVKR